MPFQKESAERMMRADYQAFLTNRSLLPSALCKCVVVVESRLTDRGTANLLFTMESFNKEQPPGSVVLTGDTLPAGGAATNNEDLAPSDAQVGSGDTNEDSATLLRDVKACLRDTNAGSPSCSPGEPGLKLTRAPSSPANAFSRSGSQRGPAASVSQSTTAEQCYLQEDQSQQRATQVLQASRQDGHLPAGHGPGNGRFDASAGLRAAVCACQHGRPPRACCQRCIDDIPRVREQGSLTWR